MSHVTVAIAVTKTLAVLFGGLITYFAFSAYQRTEAGELGALAAGFGIVTVGTILGGVVDLAGPSVGLAGQSGVLYGVLVQSVLTLAGFGVIVYSLYRG